MIELECKVIMLEANIGCNVCMTILEVVDDLNSETVLPQHLTVYTESPPKLKVGDKTTVRIDENGDYRK